MDERGEEELQAHQDGRVYPVGRVLRATYDAENHHTLGSDVTGLMIDLSRVPYDNAERELMATAPKPPGPPASSSPAPVAPPSWLVRLGVLVREGIGLAATRTR